MNDCLQLERVRDDSKWWLSYSYRLLHHYDCIPYLFIPKTNTSWSKDWIHLFSLSFSSRVSIAVITQSGLRTFFVAWWINVCIWEEGDPFWPTGLSALSIHFDFYSCPHASLIRPFDQNENPGRSFSHTCVSCLHVNERDDWATEVLKKNRRTVK